MRSFDAAVADRSDQGLGDAAEAEAAGRDGHAVEEQPVQRGGGVIVDLRSHCAATGVRWENPAGLGRGRDGAFVLVAELDHAPDQGGVRGGERVAVEAEVVLQAGPGVAAGGDAPLVEDDLVRPDAGTAPFGVGGEALEGLDVEVEDRAVDRHGVLHAHDELDVERRGEPAVPGHRRRLEDVAEIEGLDLGLDPVGQHLGGEPVDQVRAVLVDPGREVVRADGERGHVGPQREHAAALAPGAGPAAGGELDDQAWAMLAQPFEQASEALGVGAGGLIVVAYVGVRDGGAGLHRRLGRLQLLRDGDRDRRVVGLPGQAAGDGDADDACVVGHRRALVVSANRGRRIAWQTSYVK